MYYGKKRKGAVGTQGKTDVQGQERHPQKAGDTVLGLLSEVSGEVAALCLIVRGGW